MASPAAARRVEAWRPEAGGGPRVLAGFLRLLELELADVARHPEAFERLRAGELQAVIVHGVYPPPLLSALVARLERRDPPLLQTEFPPEFRSGFYGRNLNLTSGDLSGYFAEAALFNAQLATLLPAELGFERHLAGILAALDHARPFVAAPGPQPGQRYMFTTLREHREGGFIPAHFDNEQNFRPSYRHLRTRVEPHIVSFVLALTQAEDGGALEVFDLRCEPHDARFLNADGIENKPDPAHYDAASFRLPAGSLIVLDSGRYLHRLTPVIGRRKRWTACSFMAQSRAHDAMCCWG